MSKNIEKELKAISEAAFRPADNTDNGDLAPVSLNDDDFAELPLSVAPYPANLTPVSVEDIDEKDFVKSNPIVDGGYLVDPNVDALGESAILDRVGERNGVVELVGSHDNVSDEVANEAYKNKLTSQHEGSRVMRVGDKGFVIVTPEGDTAQVKTNKGKHFVRYSPMDSIDKGVIEKGHVAGILTGTKLHEGVDQEDVDAVLESAMEKLAKDAIYESNVKSDISEMFASQGLNEDVTSKTADLFEAAVTVATKKHLKSVNAAAERYITESLNVYHQTTQTQINEYLDYAINEWATENKAALETSSRNQISESFMTGLKDLFESHYIELPKDKVDLYEHAIKKGDEVLEQLNEAKVTNKALQDKVNVLTKKSIVESKLSGLVATKAERVRELCEAVEFVDSTQYQSRVDFIIESVSGKTIQKQTNTLLEDSAPKTTPIVESVEDDVAAALQFLSRK